MRSSSSASISARGVPTPPSLRCRGQARSKYIAKVPGRVSIRKASAVEAQSTTTTSHSPVSASC
ncbi:Uncharacterised protein [Mycobacteroides abscessus subsp. abscessus]|nr:Uncharacterised protein [Mycobacteroides abscessus subsp. abscessus]